MVLVISVYELSELVARTVILCDVALEYTIFVASATVTTPVVESIANLPVASSVNEYDIVSLASTSIALAVIPTVSPFGADSFTSSAALSSSYT